jgi:hypothetical protein
METVLLGEGDGAAGDIMGLYAVIYIGSCKSTMLFHCRAL